MMTVHEMCRLQAIPPRRFDFEQAGVSQKDFLHAVGNAMSANVLARLFDRVLHAAGLTHSLREPQDGAFLQFLT
jgi:site-specific DNA-cytosine methylase